VLGRRQILLAALTIAALAAVPAAARAKTIDVHPQGPATNPLQRAIDRAAPGDRIRVHHGRYRKAIEVNKRLEIFAARNEKRPVIDARCYDSIVVDVQANGVSLDGLKIIGASDVFAVNFFGIDRGKVNDLRLVNTCGRAEYGVNVFDGGAIRITDSDARGFLDAGYYIGGIQSTGNGALVLANNTASGNNRGAIVEDSFDNDVDIRVLGNDFHDNTIEGEGIPSGIFVHNSDHTKIADNRTDDNGVYGIHVDPQSDDNVIDDNHAAGNGQENYFDEGTGNCGAGNSFPIPPCG
jgi:parallel beta-helix repeat protein